MRIILLRILSIAFVLIGFIWLIREPSFEAIATIIGALIGLLSSLAFEGERRESQAESERNRSVFSNYRRHYLRHLVDRHQFFDVKGLSVQGPHNLSLMQVFVDLSIDPQSPHKTTADPLQTVPTELRGGQHPVWAYLNTVKMVNQHLVIIGAPSSGKTTLLKHMTLTLALGREARQRFKALDKLPILLFLRDHVSAIQAQAGTTADKRRTALIQRKRTLVYLAHILDQFSDDELQIVYFDVEMPASQRLEEERSQQV